MRIELHSDETPKETWLKKVQKTAECTLRVSSWHKKNEYGIASLLDWWKHPPTLLPVKMKEGEQIIITTSQRSSVESAKYDIAHQVEAVLKLAGCKVTHGDGLSNWKPNLNSKYWKLQKKATKNSTKPSQKYAHAGLECESLSEEIPASGYDFYRPNHAGSSFTRRTTAYTGSRKSLGVALRYTGLLVLSFGFAEPETLILFWFAWRKITLISTVFPNKNFFHNLCFFA